MIEDCDSKLNPWCSKIC